MRKKFTQKEIDWVLNRLVERGEAVIIGFRDGEAVYSLSAKAARRDAEIEEKEDKDEGLH